MKKILYALATFLMVGLIYLSLPPQGKISVFNAVEKPWFRLRPFKPNSYLDKKKLESKVKEGLPEWAKAQIAEDLSHFKKITPAELDEYYKKHNSPFNKLMRIKIKDGVVSIQVDDPELLNYKSYKIINNVLQYIAKHGYVMNTDFILCLQDYAILSSKTPLPIFTFSKDRTVPVEKTLILMPDWMNFRSCAELIPRIKFANDLYPWKEKTPMLFWRGSLADSSGFRHQLVDMASRYPQWVDAKFSANNPEEYVSEDRHVQYRYQITIDGARATWERLVWQLHSNSLVLKHNSHHIQWFYKGITPNVHYIPISDEAAVLKTIKWAEEKPEDANKIISNAMVFAENNLMLEDLYHYFIVLLQTYNEHLIADKN